MSIIKKYFLGFCGLLFCATANSFEYARNFSDGLAVVRINHKYGYIDTSGKIVIPAEFLFADDFKDGKAFIRNKHKVDGLIDKSGCISFILNMNSIAELDSYSCDRVIYKKLNGKYGLLNGTGKDIINEDIERIFDANECNYSFKKNGKWGLMDKDGKILLKPIYQDISRAGFINSLISAKYNNEWVFINKEDKIVFR